MVIAVGETIPECQVNGEDMSPVQFPQHILGKKVIIFGVPGCFTPGCSKTHLPGYVKDSDAIKGKGVDEIICISVNDSFVMNAWGDAHGASGKVRMFADPQANFTKAIGMDADFAPLGGTRSKRYAMIVENGKVTHLNAEPDGRGLTCSLSNNILSHL